MKNMTIKSKLIISFVLISILIMIYSIYTLYSLNKTSTNFSQYRETARNSVMLGRIQASILMVRMKVKDYIKTTNNNDIDEYRHYFDKTNNLITETKSLIASEHNSKYSKNLSLDIQKIENSLKIYNKNFKNVIRYIIERNNIVHNNLDRNGKDIEQLLTSSMDYLYAENNLVDSLEVAKDIRILLLGRLYTAKFLITNSKLDLVRAQSEFLILEDRLLNIKKNIKNKKILKKLQDAIVLIDKYIIGVIDIRSIILERNNIIDSQLNVIGPQIALFVENLKLSIKDKQDTIGPNISNENEMLLKVTIIVSFLIILISILLSILIPRDISRRINIFQKDLLNFFKFVNGDIDKFERIEMDSNDEIGIMSKVVNNNISKTKNILENTKKVNRQTFDILNSQRNIIVMSNGEDIKQVNNAFLEFFNFKSIDSFDKDYEYIMEFFIKEEGYFFAAECANDIDWIKIILNSDKLFRVKMKNDNDEIFIFQVDVSTLKNDEYFVLTFSDITLTQNQSDEIHEHQKRFSEQSKLASMGEMIGNIAHQWRQPLTVISTTATSIDVFKSAGILSDELLDKSMITINDNAQYLSQTIDDFKNFIKNDKNIVEFNISDALNSVSSLVTAPLKDNHIILELNLNDDMKIVGLKNELIQSLINIINNAKDALVENEVKNRVIFIETKSENQYLRLTIKDNAGGIKTDIIDKIFEPYFTTKHQSKGTGIGLHMTYNLIVDGMNGTIDVKNVNYEYEGENYSGAEFIVLLPLVQ